MDALPLRLLVLINVLVPLVFFMAALYLALHILFARLIGSPESPVLWFFSVVTGPLTRPVRATVARGLAEPTVRTVALVVYVVLWIVARVVLHQIVGVRSG
jgi:hypothetical protein